MKLEEPYHLPPEKAMLLRKARRLEGLTAVIMVGVACMVYLAMGSSQAMKTAWVEDVLSIIPPLIFLLTESFRSRQPSERFPYGFRSAPAIAFLAASLALILFSLFLLWEAVVTLVSRDHPTIGMMKLLGRDIWMGWVMIVVLFVSFVPPVILGRLKHPLAEKLNDKTLLADAAMNRADWLTGLAGIAGILGIGFGLWWADAAAALAISIDVLFDGSRHLRHALGDLMDERPKLIEGGSRPHPVLQQIQDRVSALEWVEKVDLRMRTDGRLWAGELFISPRSLDNLPARFSEARRVAMKTDWRIRDIVVTFLEEEPPWPVE